jgi:hypothetical protein
VAGDAARDVRAFGAATLRFFAAGFADVLVGRFFDAVFDTVLAFGFDLVFDRPVFAARVR